MKEIPQSRAKLDSNCIRLEENGWFQEKNLPLKKEMKDYLIGLSGIKCIEKLCRKTGTVNS